MLSSYDYRSVDDYQIPRDQWNTYRSDYLRRANLLGVSQPAITLVALNNRLNKQLKQTNEGLANNPQVYFDAHGGWH